MGKNVLLGLNGLLALAVAFLFWHTFKGKSSAAPSPSAQGISKGKDSADTKLAIAYIDVDSINASINYIKRMKGSLEEKQKRIENEWRGGMQALENKKNNFLKRGAEITQAEAEKFQAQLMEEGQTIERKKELAVEALSNENFKFNDDLKKHLREFLEEYNKQKKYAYILTTGKGLDFMVFKDPALNITADVIAGLNAKLK